MSSPSIPIHDDGLCLRLWDWSETSQGASMLTREHGLVRGLAKGSKRATHPFSGGLELLTLGGVGMILKPTADLAVFTEWDLTETFPALRRDLPAHYAAMYIADAVHHLLEPRDPHPGLLDEVVRALLALGGPDTSVNAILLRLQWALLVQCGYRPSLGDADTAMTAFNPELGQLVAATGATSGAWRVRTATVTALRRVEAVVEASAQDWQWATDLTDDSLERGARLLAAYVRYVIDAHLPTLALVFPSLKRDHGL